MTSKRNNKAFSLVELLIVIGIIALLATIGTIAATSFARKAKEQKTHAIMDLLMGAITAYQESTGAYPFKNESTWRECDNTFYTFIKGDPAAFDKVKLMPKDSFITNSSGEATGFWDAWENPLYYNAKGGMGGTPALKSYGADGQTGSTATNKDDVYSYRK